ncbi:2,3-diaminopropionate biosynthesis protein SbnA [Tistrella mobilis]|uniref:2,3-diaminopropionate biosynthesis protein SbnA n=1 Tax=Tistrella mobilis TaxID=171437 RepID=UPI0035561582
MHIEDLAALIQDDVFVPVRIDAGGGVDILLKIEGLNPAGSIKFKTALAMIADMERSERLKPGATVVESSSGNLGLALSIVCRALGYGFVCVSDPNISPATRDMIEATGGRMEPVTETDENGGYLGTRLRRIATLLDRHAGWVWTNQYGNPAAKWAHHRWTGPAVRRRVDRPDFLFVGVGTAGTAMGCAEYFRINAPDTRVIGVDSVGSVTFGQTPGRRYLPGLGASQQPPLFEATMLDEQVIVPETETVTACWRFRRRHGFLIGASTGTVLAGIARHAAAGAIPPGATVVALSPDLGDRYAATLYDAAWIGSRYDDLPPDIAEALAA